MTHVQLHQNIRYVPLSDDEGDFGLLVHHDGQHVYAAVEIDSREMFAEVYDEMLALRRTRDELMAV